MEANDAGTSATGPVSAATHGILTGSTRAVRADEHVAKLTYVVGSGKPSGQMSTAYTTRASGLGSSSSAATKR